MQDGKRASMQTKFADADGSLQSSLHASTLLSVIGLTFHCGSVEATQSARPENDLR
jgi:hypothetical protein